MSNLYLALNPATGILPIGWHIQCHGFTCHIHEDDPNSIFLFLTLFWVAIYLLDISTYMSSIKICWIIKRKSLTTHLLNDSSQSPTLNISGLCLFPFLSLSCLSWLTLNQLVCCNSSSLTSIAFSFLLSLGYLDLNIYNSFSSIFSWLCPFQFQSVYPSGRLIILKDNFRTICNLSKSSYLRSEDP